MEQRTIAEMFDAMSNRLGVESYNYTRFTRDLAGADIRNTAAGKGIGPGCIVPDFELKDTSGVRVRLSDLKGKPVLLRFGSIS